MKKTMRICGAGCCLVDRIYPDIDFHGPAVQKYWSRQKGDGGLHPGRLVFADQFEAYTGQALEKLVQEISAASGRPQLNVGGPSVVALIHAAQLLHGSEVEIAYYGVRGDDHSGEFLMEHLKKTPVDLEHLLIARGTTPSTIVLSDPAFHEGHGERIFINDIGAAWNFGPEELDASFFDAEIVVFGGTALVPRLHEGLSELLEEAKNRHCLTVVNTVYDFHSEFRNAGERWPLGSSDRSYEYIDLLITDAEEALHLSGEQHLDEACLFFIEKGVSALLVTNGTADTWAYSEGNIFRELALNSYPVSRGLIEELKSYQGGDTTGCGDNFVGGVLASLAWQIQEKEEVSLEEALAWGTVSGGFCCFHLGGTYLEEERGEKHARILPYYMQYKKQIHE